MTADTVVGAEAGVYRTVNPATGQIVRGFPALGDGQAQDALARAHAAYPGWSRAPGAERARLLARLATLAEARSEELARLVTLEMGKPLAQSRREAALAAAMCRYYAEHGQELLVDRPVQIPGFARAVTRREPVGVVVGIEPWNAPLYQAMRAAAPNLMLGNTVLLKPAEQCAGSTLLLDRLFAEAGFPGGAYQTVLASRAQVSGYIADPRVRAVTLTGSDRAGFAVGEQAGRHAKPVVLELGGSDAFIVLDSADVPAAAATAASCRLNNAGQVCASPKRIIVTDAVAGEFTARFTRAFSGQRVGDPFDPRTMVGPLASVAAADALQAQYQDALDKGATVLVPGGRLPGPGAWFEPAAITGITPAMRVYAEEAFGPLAMIYRVPDAGAAITLANSSPYGLGGTVFGRPDDALQVAEQLDTGGVGINAYLGAPIQIPFGGTKSSGTGRELGPTGMDQFANIKTYATA